MRRRWGATGSVMLWLMAAACAPDIEPTAPPEPPKPVTFDIPPSPYEDALVELSRYTKDGYPGTDFVEILDVEVHGGHVFNCTATQSLLIVDREDPVFPIVGSAISTVGYDKRCQHVAVDDTRIVITNRGDEYAPVPHVTLFEPSNLTHPPELAAFYPQDGTSFEGVVIVEPGVYAVGMHERGVALLEEQTTDGELTLVERGRIEGFANVWDLALEGSRLWVSDEDGVAVAELSGDAGTIVGRLDLPGTSKHVAVGGGGAFVAAGSAGVHVVTLDSAGMPRLQTTIETPGSALMSAYAEGYLYVADWNDVRVFDVTDLAAPTLVTTEYADVPGFARYLAIGAEGDHAYLGEWTGLYDHQLVAPHRAPDIGFSEPSLEFPTTAPGDSATLPLRLVNEGQEPLVISTAHATERFRADVESLTLAPGETRELSITFTPEAHDFDKGTLTLISDDPDQQLVEIFLRGNHLALGVGDPIPDYAWTNLQDGEPVSMEGLRGSVVVLSYFATF